MTCVACRSASRRPLCGGCGRDFRRGRDQMVGGVLVRSAFAHDGPARRLVHRLKYEAVWGVDRFLAAAMGPLVPVDATALVPVPRVEVRRRLHGVDPAVALAEAVGELVGLPVVSALGARVWTERRAGPAGRRRGTPSFAARRPVPDGAVLVDDVVTSGATLRAAAASSGIRRAVTATAGHSTLPQAASQS